MEFIDMVRRYAYKESNFTLSSGKQTTKYVDMSKLTLTAKGLKKIVSFMQDNRYLDGWDCVAGPALGAVPLIAGLLCGKHGCKRGAIIREQAKSDGSLVEGNLR